MLSLDSSILVIICCCLAGLTWAIINAFQLSKVKIQTSSNLSESYNKFQNEDESDNNQKNNLLLEVASYIERGSQAFLQQEYIYIGMFVVFMAFVIFFAVEQKIGQMWTTIAFLLGCVTSIVSGYIGMRVAVFSNYRCAYRAQTSMSAGFKVAYQAGCVMGFCLTSLGLLILTILITLYTKMFIGSNGDYEDYSEMYEAIAGYGLGGSTIALFGRVGGGIFTKAADVGADLVGKVEQDLPEDSPSNPATIADNVGDNVGDIAGMGSDLFGSFAEATAAALVVASQSPSFYYQPAALLYPLMISAFGIIVSLVTSTFAFGRRSETFKAVSSTLK